MVMTLALSANAAVAQLVSEITMEKVRYAVGEPIYVRFTLTNVGKEPEQFMVGSAYSMCSGHSIQVSRGRPLQHSSCDTGVSGSCISGQRVVGPGESYADTVLVNYEHDLSEPGSYAIQALQVVRYGPKTDEIVHQANGPEVREERVFEIVVVGGNEAEQVVNLQPYVSQLNSKDEETRMEAARVIASTAPKSMEDTLVAMLKIPAAHGLALEGLRRINTEKARAALAEIVKNTKEYSWDKERAIRFLGEMGDKSYFALLQGVAEATPPNQARDYVWAAAELGGDDAMPFVMELLSSKDPFSRGNGVMALPRTGSRSAVPVLIELLRGGNEDVGVLASNGLIRITHRSPFPQQEWGGAAPGETYGEWKRWWSAEGASAKLYGPGECGEIEALQ